MAEDDKTRPYTRHLKLWGWAGALMWWAGAVGSAVYTTASVTCNWAGAVMQKPLAKCRKRRKSKGERDGPTERQTERPTDRHSDLWSRVARDYK